LSRCAWTTTTAAGRSRLRHVVNAVTEVIDIVVEELVRCTISCRTWRLARTLFAGWGAFARFLLTGRTLATFTGRLLFALVLAFIFTTAATAAAIRPVAAWAT
jgi:hypothetical protein